MRKADVIAHFGTQVAVARAIGLTKSAINQWPERVPFESALRVQAATGGLLSVDMALYELPELPRPRTVRRHAVA
jgi:transcriptional repressor of cell division inhibition gene dicB